MSKVLGEVEHQVTLFDKFFLKKNNFTVFQACHSLIFMYCSWNKYCLCYLFGCGLRIKTPESQKEFKLFLLCLYNNSVNFSVSSLLPPCMWSIVDTTDTFCQAYSDVAWDHGVQSPGRNFTLKSSIFLNYTVQIGFYSIFSLHPAYEVNTVFIVVEFTWKWPENKYPESWDAQINKEFCLCC